jgi:7,8-dihydroneopterin aldolase/epimerase/oxygenase
MSAVDVDVRGLRVFAYHGVHPEERRLGQEFVVDVHLRCRPSPAAETDDVADAVDYGAVCERVVEVVRGGPFNLIETVAARVADDLLARFPVASATVRVAKPAAPIPHPFAEVAVTVTRP